MSLNTLNLSGELTGCLPRLLHTIVLSGSILFWTENGRVARLFTDYYLTNTGMDGYGLWSISRGFAHFRENYVQKLADADTPKAPVRVAFSATTATKFGFQIKI